MKDRGRLGPYLLFVLLLVTVMCPSASSANSFKTFIRLNDGGTLPVYCFLPQQGAKGPLPAVIVAAGVGAVKIAQYHEHCQLLANRNFVVAFIDPSNYPEELAPGPWSWDWGLGYLKGSVNQGVVGARLMVSNKWYLATIRATVDFLCSWPMVDCTRIALSGFSQPANAALAYACQDPRIKAVIWNYGGWPWIMPYEPLRLPPVQIFHGEDDNVYDVKYAKQLALELKSNMRCYELNVYPHEKHMFNIYYDMKRGENRFMKPALMDAFERMVAFLYRTMAVPPPQPIAQRRRIHSKR